MRCKKLHGFVAKPALITMLFLGIFIFKTVAQQDNGQNIRLNQIGFYPAAAKTAIVLKSTDSVFFVQTSSHETVFTGTLKKSDHPDFSGSFTRIADFSSFKKPGH